jgi:hypothetical protein
VEEKGYRRLAFVGPKIVRDFIGSIIGERKLNLVFTGYYREWRELGEIDAGAYDLVLLFDDVPGGVNRIAESLDISRDKLVPLW